jgi:hypothetical protein
MFFRVSPDRRVTGVHPPEGKAMLYTERAKPV